MKTYKGYFDIEGNQIFNAGLRQGKQFDKDLQFIKQILDIKEVHKQDLKEYALVVSEKFYIREPLESFIKEHKIEIICNKLVNGATYFMKKEELLKFIKEEHKWQRK